MLTYHDMDLAGRAVCRDMARAPGAPGMTEAAAHIVLFNDERYQQLNRRPGQRLFRCDHVVAGRLVGTLSGVVEDGLLDCGHSAPFGGIDFVRRRETVGDIADLLRAAISRARDEGIGEIRI